MYMHIYTCVLHVCTYVCHEYVYYVQGDKGDVGEQGPKGVKGEDGTIGDEVRW